MKKSEFIAEALEIIQRVHESAMGIADWLGETTPEDAAADIAALVPGYVWEREDDPK